MNLLPLLSSAAVTTPPPCRVVQVVRLEGTNVEAGKTILSERIGHAQLFVIVLP